MNGPERQQLRERVSAARKAQVAPEPAEPRPAGGKHSWPLPDGVQGRAVFSLDGEYRYVLRREWEGGSGVCTFVGLNPSTAKAEADDPTVRKCWRWAREWGYTSMVMLNLFAYRTTSPAALADSYYPVGYDNDAYLAALAAEADLLIAAWGNSKHVRADARDEEVTALLLEHVESGWIHALALCQDGSPRHPLYLPNATKPIPWRQRKEKAAA